MRLYLAIAAMSTILGAFLATAWWLAWDVSRMVKAGDDEDLAETMHPDVVSYRDAGK